MGIACGAAYLALKLAVARGVDGGKRGACVGKGLWIRDSTGGAKNAQKLIALAANASEHAELLQNHGPGNDREKEKKRKNAPRDPARLRKDISDIGYKNSGEQKNDVPLSESR